MTGPGDGYEVVELDDGTWPLFERLFGRGNGWDFCGCMLHLRGRHLPRRDFPTRAGQRARNLAEHRGIVAAGRAQGILVLDGAEPVGWCQFVPVDDGWRITCFVVDKRHRRRGVAHRALTAALVAIERRGGGLVEARPVIDARPSGAHAGYLSLFTAHGFAPHTPTDTPVTVRRHV